MRRRRFFGLSLTAGLGLFSRGASGQPAPPDAADDLEAVDPYFLDPGLLDGPDPEALEAYLRYQDQTMAGQRAVMPRGGRPKRAPTFRFLHWRGDLGDENARLEGPLSVKPKLSGPGPFYFNAQILGFHASTADWSGSSGKGALTIELRGRDGGEALTWLYLEQFSVTKGGGNSIGLQYVAQRNGIPDPVVTERPNLDLRIQLIRYRKAPRIFNQILRIGSFLTGGAIPGGPPRDFESTAPLVRVPRMVHEGVALAQATVGGLSDERPVWGGGFTTFGLASGGSRLALAPGYWLAIDESAEVDYASLRLEDQGGRLGVTRDGSPVDLNYLVLGVDIRSVGHDARGVVPKGG